MSSPQPWPPRAEIERGLATARKVYARAVEIGQMAEADRISNLALMRLLLGSYHAKAFTRQEQAALNRAALMGYILTCSPYGVYRLTEAGHRAVLEMMQAAAEREQYTGEAKR